MKFALAPVRFAAWVLVALIWLPVPALVVSAVTDRGPTGAIRATFFNAALCLWNPIVWDAVWNSLVIAVIVTGLSAVFGAASARLTCPWRYWGRPAVRGLGSMPLVLGPFSTVLGLRFLADRLGLVEATVARFGFYPVFGISTVTASEWLLLITGYILVGTPVIARAMEVALSRVDPRWIEAGRAAGASRAQARRDLVRPNLKPTLARGCALVFSVTLLDPGGPIAARLPRTLAGLILESALISRDIGRASVLVLIGLGVAALGWLLLRRWGGSIPIAPPDARPNRPARASWRRAGFSLIALTGWAAVGLLPLAGFGLAMLGRGDAEVRPVYLMSVVYYDLLDRKIARMLIVSGLLGASTALAGVSAASIATLGASRSLGRLAALVARPLRAVPALGTAVGALALARLSEPVLGSFLDPSRNPGPLLLLASLAIWLPVFLQRAAEGWEASRPEQVDAALAFGAGRREATRIARGPRRGFGFLLASVLLAAGDLLPALLLTPAGDVRPLGPTILDLMESPSRAAALAVPLIMLRVAAGLLGGRGSLTAAVH